MLPFMGKETFQLQLDGLNHFSNVQLFATLWAIAHQAPLCIQFSKQKYWSGLPFPPPRNLPSPRIEPGSPASPALQVDSLPLRHPSYD